MRTYIRSSPSDEHDITDKEEKKEKTVIKKEKYGGREREIDRETERKRNSTSRNYYENS